jgi:hypothetical protein
VRSSGTILGVPLAHVYLFRDEGGR